ncbi:MAG: AGE family epimerase/isomerase [Gemmatimonadetes bacterium]|nr:AGE family epimerase/isomerase [Gemmatimonadota bacterium]
MNAPPDVKLYRTHMHILEAFTTYYELTRDETARSRLVELIFVQSSAMVRKPLGACTDWYRRDWTPLRQR